MSRSINKNDEFKDRLLKLIPSEIVAAYAAIQGFLIAQDTLIVIAVIVILFVMTYFYLLKVEEVKDLKHRVFATISFLVWVYAIAPETILDELHEVLYNPPLASITLILWTLLIPIVITKVDASNQ